MASKRPETRLERNIAHWMAEVNLRSNMFEGRWTMLALQRVDPELAERLFDQMELFRQATLHGSNAEVEMHGAATCRGYEAAARRMMDEPDDAYLQGHDPKTGCRVVVGHRASREHVLATHEGVIFVTPDEVAVMLGTVEAMKPIKTVKEMFPGAEIIRRYHDEDDSEHPDTIEVLQ